MYYNSYESETKKEWIGNFLCEVDYEYDARPSGPYDIPRLEPVSCVILQYSGDEETITLPDYCGDAPVTGVRLKAFERCSAAAFETNSDDVHYCYIQDGVLYDKDKSILVRYPPKKPDRVFTIPDFVRKIADSAFRDCENLEEVVFSSRFTEMNQCSFQNCVHQVKFVFPDGDEIPSSQIVREEKKPEDDSCTEDGVLYNADKSVLRRYPPEKPDRSFTIPDSVKRVDRGAFKRCELMEIIIPNHCIQIGESAFENSYWLQKISLPDDMTQLEESVFENCHRLKKVHLPDRLEVIKKSAFKGCEGLESIEIPASVRVIPKMAFSFCKGLKSVKLPPKLEVISCEAFEYCDSLEAIEIPDSVRYIPDHVFSGCKNLKSVTLPKNIERIGEGAFNAENPDFVLYGSNKVAKKFAKSNGIKYQKKR